MGKRYVRICILTQMLCIDNTFHKPCIQIAHIPRNRINFSTIALVKVLQSKSIDIFLISPRKRML